MAKTTADKYTMTNMLEIPYRKLYQEATDL